MKEDTSEEKLEEKKEEEEKETQKETPAEEEIVAQKETPAEEEKSEDPTGQTVEATKEESAATEIEEVKPKEEVTDKADENKKQGRVPPPHFLGKVCHVWLDYYYSVTVSSCALIGHGLEPCYDQDNCVHSRGMAPSGYHYSSIAINVIFV